MPCSCSGPGGPCSNCAELAAALRGAAGTARGRSLVWDGQRIQVYEQIAVQNGAIQSFDFRPDGLDAENHQPQGWILTLKAGVASGADDGRCIARLHARTALPQSGAVPPYQVAWHQVGTVRLWVPFPFVNVTMAWVNGTPPNDNGFMQADGIRATLAEAAAGIGTNPMLGFSEAVTLAGAPAVGAAIAPPGMQWWRVGPSAIGMNPVDLIVLRTFGGAGGPEVVSAFRWTPATAAECIDLHRWHALPPGGTRQIAFDNGTIADTFTVEFCGSIGGGDLGTAAP